MERKRNLGIDLVETGNLIDKAMNKKGYTARQVASMMGLTYQSVWKWRKGETLPDVENLLILSRVLDTTMDALVASLDSSNSRIDCVVSKNMSQGKSWKLESGRCEVNTEKARMKDFAIAWANDMVIVLEYGVALPGTDCMRLGCFSRLVSGYNI